MDLRMMVMALGLVAAGGASAAVSVVNGDFEDSYCSDGGWAAGMPGWDGNGGFGAMYVLAHATIRL